MDGAAIVARRVEERGIVSAALFSGTFPEKASRRTGPANTIDRYRGSGNDYCSASRCMKDYGICNDPVSSVSGSDAPTPTSCSISTLSPCVVPSCIVPTRIITSVRTETSTLTVQADQVTVMSRSTLTLPGANRPTTIIRPTTITLSPDPVMNTTTSDPPAVTQTSSATVTVTIFEEEGNCIVCLDMRADKLVRHLISGELTSYRIVCTSTNRYSN
jgi:hypothetical protein